MDSAFGIFSFLLSESSAINVFETNGRFDEEINRTFLRPFPEPFAIMHINRNDQAVIVQAHHRV